MPFPPILQKALLIIVVLWELRICKLPSISPRLIAFEWGLVYKQGEGPGAGVTPYLLSPTATHSQDLSSEKKVTRGREVQAEDFSGVMKGEGKGRGRRTRVFGRGR